MKNYVRYIISLEEPVKMGNQSNQANSEALDYIAGSTLRGAIIREELLRRGIQDASKELGEDGYRNLFSAMRFFDAYIINKEEEKYMIPVPLIYYASKHKIRENEKMESENKRTLLEIHNCIDEPPQEGEQRVDVSKYCYPGKELYSQSVRKTANLHVSVKNERAMFRYEAIAAGQEFAGVIECTDETQAKHFKELLADCILYLGGSKGSGYGRCRIHDIVCMDYDKLLEGYHIQKKEKKDRLTIYALSNLLLVDENGQNTGVIPEQYLKEKLQLDSVTLERSYVSTAIASGFNHTWKAGQIQQTAVKAGSVYVYTYTGTLAKERVTALEKNMLGSRKQDGFGRILINAEWNQTRRCVLHAESHRQADKKLSEEDKEVLAMIQHSVNRDRITKSIQKQALACAENSRNMVSKFSLSQIARLFNMTEKLITEDISDDIRKQEIEKFREEIFDRETITGEKAERTSKTAKAYEIAKLRLPSGYQKEMENVLKDLNPESVDDWGICRPVMGTDAKHSDAVICVSLTEQAHDSTPSLLELKIRFLNAVMYNLMRKEGGR